MHPISSKNFGSAAGAIQITFHNGTSVTSGYIIKQLGLTRYLVTVDGTTKYVITLAQTTQAATTLTALTGTVALTENGNTHYVTKIMSKQVYTTDGSRFQWTTGTPAGTTYGLASISALALLGLGDNQPLLGLDGQALVSAS